MAARREYVIDDLQEWASALGGDCLSTVYVNIMTQYEWLCGICGNVWMASWNNVNHHKSWCPDCASSLREVVVRKAFEENLPGHAFAKNRSAIGAEIDGYCEELGLGFEHDGEQHHEHVPHFHRTENAFEQQQARDKAKDEKCFDEWITLIRIPSRKDLPLKDIRAYVRSQISDLGYDVVPESELVDEETFFRSVQTARTVDASTRYLQMATSKLPRGHVMVSDSCASRTWPLKVTCAVGHEYATTFDNIVRGRGCPVCGGTMKKSAEEMAAAAAERGYEFLAEWSEKDATGKARHKMRVQCPAKHETVVIEWGNFKAGKGCVHCRDAGRGKHRRLGGDEMADRLAGFGVRAVDAYKNNTTPMLFECLAKNHQFRGTLQKLMAAPDDRKCAPCFIETFPEAYKVELVGEWNPDTDSARSKLKWRCLQCRTEFEVTYRGFLIRSDAKKCKACR